MSAHGGSDVRPTGGGVHFTASLRAAFAMCVNSRLAGRVSLWLFEGEALSADELYAAVRALPWEEHLLPNGTFAIRLVGKTAYLDNTLFGIQRSKDAIVDRFIERVGSRPSVDRDRPDVSVVIAVRGARLQVGIDLTNDSLHRRRYRQPGALAPLKENLAAGILLRAGWHEIARTGGAFVDPMCGSGTLVVEAALIAYDIAPGLLGDAAARGWRGFVAEDWQAVLSEAKARAAAAAEKGGPTLFGFDADPVAVAQTQAAARAAGVAAYIRVEKREISAGLPALPRAVVEPVESAAQSADLEQAPLGLIAVNPPYGERLAAEGGLGPLYGDLGRALITDCPGFRAVVLLGDEALGPLLGLRAHKKHSVFNGPLPCTLLTFALDVRQEKKREAKSTKHAPARSREAEELANRLKKNRARLRSFLASEEIHCYRLYDRDLPEMALAIDVYEDAAHVQEYAPPADIAAEKAQARLAAALAVIPEALGIPAERVFLKTRRRQKGGRQYEKQAVQGERLEVREGGLRFWVNLTDYLDTGLFLDHRRTRAKVRKAAAGKHFLNLFCYTGTVSVYAAAGGAASTVSVDLSKTYLDWAYENFVLNHIGGDAHELIHADVMAWLDEARRERRRFDLIFVDPPTFSKSKRATDDFDVQRDHAALLSGCGDLLAPDGAILFSTNFRRFELDPSLEKRFAVREISEETLPKDFERNARIHRAFWLEPHSRGRHG